MDYDTKTKKEIMETQLENPNGLYQKYYIQKIVPAKK